MIAGTRPRVIAGMVAAALALGGLLVGRYLVPAGDAGTEAGGTAGTDTGLDVTSQADIGFSQDMTAHHAQAIRMAAAVRGRVAPEVDALAAQVFEAQVHESGVLKGWLQLWDAPQLPSGPHMSWTSDHEGTGDGPAAADGESPPMPGMASQDEVNRLDDLSGTELEIWFLQLMVRHHEGGILMAQAAAGEAEVPAVQSLAATMALQQQREITLMLGLLDARGARSLPAR